MPSRRSPSTGSCGGAGDGRHGVSDGRVTVLSAVLDVIVGVEEAKADPGGAGDGAEVDLFASLLTGRPLRCRPL